MKRVEDREDAPMVPMLRYLRALVTLLAVVMALGMIAIEAGWVVTEVGRQPWVIYEIMRTKDAATPMPGMIVPFLVTLVVYLGLSAAVILVMHRQIRIAPGLPPQPPAGLKREIAR